MDLRNWETVIKFAAKEKAAGRLKGDLSEDQLRALKEKVDRGESLEKKSWFTLPKWLKG